MSDRDKKLLVYLGALVLLAAAYFLVVRPYLDKIETISNENTNLEMEYQRKKSISDKAQGYLQRILEAEEEIDKIIEKFPEDNTDEKSIMFIAKMEKDIPVWVNSVKFADEIKDLVSGQEDTDTSDKTNQAENDALENNEATDNSETDSNEEDVDSEDNLNQNYYGLDSEIGYSFVTDYGTFKKMLEYIRDYEDRIVVKEIDVAYDNVSSVINGNIILSQYAILSNNRRLDKVDTGIEGSRLGTRNIFSSSGNPNSISGDFLNTIVAAGGLEGYIPKDTGDSIHGSDYFVKVSSVTDNSDGITIGRRGDVPGETYITSRDNVKQKVDFIITGSEGNYTVAYKIGGNIKRDSFERNVGENVMLDIISSERMNDGDKTSADLHITNESDLALVVSVEGDDVSMPRINIVEKNGDVTVR